MRSFYGVDRVDNAFFISENFSESLIERDYLFGHFNKEDNLVMNQDISRSSKIIKALAAASSSELSGTLSLAHFHH